MKRILQGVAERYDLKVQIRRVEPIEEGVDIILDHRGHIPIEGVPHIRGSHMVRDPRDMAASAYHYHLWAKEKWLHVPREMFGGKSYQEYLLGLDPVDGLSAQIRQLSSSTFRRMAEWDYRRPNYFELRYEDVMADEASWFDRLFRHYGFNRHAVDAALSISERMSFAKTAGRTVGVVKEGTHFRSGVPGQWREEFTPDHIALFKERIGDLLIRLGYESDDHW
jgi:hypothetical protein